MSHLLKVFFFFFSFFFPALLERLTSCDLAWRFQRYIAFQTSKKFCGKINLYESLTCIPKLDGSLGHILGHTLNDCPGHVDRNAHWTCISPHWNVRPRGSHTYLWKFQAHYHSLTGTNDSNNVVKFSINRLIIKVDSRSINKAHTIKFAICLLCVWNCPAVSSCVMLGVLKPQ